MSEHHQIEWNAAKQDWFCVRCLRSSDHLSKEDAESELNRYNCLHSTNADPATNTIVNERRVAVRKKTSVQAEIVLHGRSIPMRVSTSDLSLGGCYIENMFTLPIGARLTIGLWIGTERVQLTGIVKTCDPVFGNGIQFVEAQPEKIAKLENYLAAATDS